MCCFFFFFKQKTAYEMRISDWSSDVCSSDLGPGKILAAKKRAARMIAKHVPMKATAKSDFGGLVRYITSAQGRDERVGVVTVTNCRGETPEDAAQDVMLVQSANQRAASDKTYHLIIRSEEHTSEPQSQKP